MDRGKIASLVASAVAVALTGVSWGDAQLRYTPVPGGYRANNGDGEFNRPLYGWHGDDRELRPCLDHLAGSVPACLRSTAFTLIAINLVSS